MRPKWIIGSDFNAKHGYWGSRVESTKGRNLHQAVINTNSNCVFGCTPIYWPTDALEIPDCIDFFITHRVLPNYLHIANISDLSFDHSPIILTLAMY